MAKPEFTTRELWIINYYKDRGEHLIANQLFADLGQIGPPLIFAVWGLWNDSAVTVAIGFFALLMTKLAESYRGRGWTKAFAEIFRKYDAALKSDGESQT
jgi:hypothetical protein